LGETLFSHCGRRNGDVVVVQHRQPLEC
jgi:hypothetical protein